MCEESLAATTSLDSWYTANARVAVAEAMLASGDAHGAQTALAELEPQFAKVGQNDSRWRALVLAARASAAMRDLSASRQFAVQALNVLGGLESSWGSEAYRGYLSRPDIGRERQLAQSFER